MVFQFQLFSIDDVLEVSSEREHLVDELFMLLQSNEEEFEDDYKYKDVDDGTEEINLSQVIDVIKKNIDDEDKDWKKIWAHRFAREIVTWFSLTNPEAY